VQAIDVQIPIDEQFSLALRAHQAGDLQRAARGYETILAAQPSHAGAWHLLGVVCQQTGKLVEAAEHIGRALALDHTKAVYHSNYGVALRGLGRLDEAEQAFERAVMIQPAYADAHSNLGITRHELGQPQAALVAFQRAIQHRPNHPDALFNLGNLLQDVGRTGEAIQIYRKALAVRPDQPETFNNLGNALLSEKRAAEAVENYQKALVLSPHYAEARLNLGAAYADQDMVTEAAECFERAACLRPDKPLWRYRLLSLSPAVFTSVEEIDEYRAGLMARLDNCLSAAVRISPDRAVSDGFTPSFHLAHHGRDNRPVMEKFSAIVRPWIPNHAPQRRKGKPRIGFLVTHPHEGGFVRTMGGLIERISGDHFQVVVLCSEKGLATCRAGIQRADLEWAPFPSRFTAAAERITAAQCDLLYYRKVGADPLGYCLPFARLAPVQCTAWGTHTTSGIREVDYYLSSGLVEVENADEHFTESLFRLDCLPSFHRRLPAVPPATRSDFGLPECGGLYLAPQRLAKFHPAQDELFRQVLNADPEGHLVVLAGKRDYALRQLQVRWTNTLGSVARRIIVLPSQTAANFRRLLSVGDALLDIRQYNVSLMAYDAFSVNLPVVTLPGRLTVERAALGFYRHMGLEHLVAETPAQYVELAVRLGTDTDFRALVRTLLADRRDVLFEDPLVVHEHERFFDAALARLQS
jgi:predicted O-linked N-acetylglucosamine transferase (SPINDLY family)